MGMRGSSLPCVCPLDPAVAIQAPEKTPERRIIRKRPPRRAGRSIVSTLPADESETSTEAEGGQSSECLTLTAESPEFSQVAGKTLDRGGKIRTVLDVRLPIAVQGLLVGLPIPFVEVVHLRVGLVAFVAGARQHSADDFRSEEH